MASIVEKLNYLKETKNIIKQELAKKGMEIPEGASFRSIANKIKDLSVGSSAGSYIDFPWTQPFLTENGTLGGDTCAVETNVPQLDASTPYHGFDGNPSDTLFHSARDLTSGYFTFYSPEPIKVTKITTINQDKNNGRASNSGTVYASNDNNLWVSLGTYENNNPQSIYSWDIDLSNNTGYYKYYKVESVGIKGGGQWDTYWVFAEVLFTAYTKKYIGGTPSEPEKPVEEPIFTVNEDNTVTIKAGTYTSDKQVEDWMTGTTDYVTVDFAEATTFGSSTITPSWDDYHHSLSVPLTYSPRITRNPDTYSAHPVSYAWSFNNTSLNGTGVSSYYSRGCTDSTDTLYSTVQNYGASSTIRPVCSVKITPERGHGLYEDETDQTLLRWSGNIYFNSFTNGSSKAKVRLDIYMLDSSGNIVKEIHSSEYERYLTTTTSASSSNCASFSDFSGFGDTKIPTGGYLVFEICANSPSGYGSDGGLLRLYSFTATMLEEKAVRRVALEKSTSGDTTRFNITEDYNNSWSLGYFILDKKKTPMLSWSKDIPEASKNKPLTSFTIPSGLFLLEKVPAEFRVKLKYHSKGEEAIQTIIGSSNGNSNEEQGLSYKEGTGFLLTTSKDTDLEIPYTLEEGTTYYITLHYHSYQYYLNIGTEGFDKQEELYFASISDTTGFIQKGDLIFGNSGVAGRESVSEILSFKVLKDYETVAGASFE